MQRTFNALQRRILAFAQAGKCAACGAPLPPSFHADHVVPWSKGGPTTTSNGAALCPHCNLTKGNKTMNFQPREWQSECHVKAWDWLVTQAKDRHFLINACPGAGKTIMGAWLARDLLAQGLVKRVIVIAPRTSVVNTWARDFKRLTGRMMMKMTGLASRGAPHYPDICATWAAISGMLPAMQAICRSSDTLVICDEHHHAAFAAAWGEDAGSAFAQAKYVLALTGTPTRSDGNGMQWFELDDDGSISVPEAASFTLGYRRAIAAGYCQPMVFHRHQGEFVTKAPGGQTVHITPNGTTVEGDATNCDLTGQEFNRIIKQPHYANGQPAMPSYHHSMLEWARAKLDDLRNQQKTTGGLPEAAGLVAAPTIEMAEYFADLIAAVEGEAPVIVHSRLPGADQLIEEFRDNTERRWIVNVNMVNEGVDIPRVRVIINLGMAQTELYFRQLAGRAIRSTGNDDYSRAYMIIPELPKLLQWATTYEEEQGLIEPKRPKKPGESKEPKDWSCKVCETLNPPHTTTCHACGAEKGKRIRREAPVYEITMSNGRRAGIITGSREVNEDLVIEGERLTTIVSAFDAIKPGTARTLLAWFRPEEMASAYAHLKEAIEWAEQNQLVLVPA